MATPFSLPDGLVSGAYRWQSRILSRICTPNFILRIARATGLKYLAGTEIAAGFFAMDALPEEKARELAAGRDNPRMRRLWGHLSHAPKLMAGSDIRTRR